MTALAEYTITRPSETSDSTAHRSSASNRTGAEDGAGVVAFMGSELPDEALEGVAPVLEVLELVVRGTCRRQEYSVAGLCQGPGPPYGLGERSAGVHGGRPLVGPGEGVRVLAEGEHALHLA